MEALRAISPTGNTSRFTLEPERHLQHLVTYSNSYIHTLMATAQWNQRPFDNKLAGSLQQWGSCCETWGDLLYVHHPPAHDSHLKDFITGLIDRDRVHLSCFKGTVHTNMRLQSPSLLTESQLKFHRRQKNISGVSHQVFRSPEIPNYLEKTLFTIINLVWSECTSSTVHQGYKKRWYRGSLRLQTSRLEPFDVLFLFVSLF